MLIFVAVRSRWHEGEFSFLPSKMSVPKIQDLSLYPDYMNHRMEMFDRLMAEQVQKEPFKITVKLLDGRLIDAEAHKTTPLDICIGISKSLADRVVIAKVDGI
jgi:TGS domain